MLLDKRQELPCPPGHVGPVSEIGQRTLRSPLPTFNLGKLIAEANQEFPVTLALVERKHHDTTKVMHIPILPVTFRFGEVLLLREVPLDVEPLLIEFASDVEQERFSIKSKRLMVEKQLAEVTQILAIDGLSLSVNFKHRDLIISVDLISRRMPEATFQRVTADLGA